MATYTNGSQQVNWRNHMRPCTGKRYPNTPSDPIVRLFRWRYHSHRENRSYEQTQTWFCHHVEKHAYPLLRETEQHQHHKSISFAAQWTHREFKRQQNEWNNRKNNAPVTSWDRNGQCLDGLKKWYSNFFKRLTENI